MLLVWLIVIDSIKNRVIQIHLLLMMLELFTKRSQLLGSESRHLCLFPQLVQLLVLEQALVLVRTPFLMGFLAIIRFV